MNLFFIALKPVYRSILLFGLLFADFTVGFALDPNKPVTKYFHEAWTTEQGLPQSATHGVVQTDDGYLWFATHSGLARFDGLEFKVYTAELPDKVGHALVKAQDGSLWLGTNGGLTQIKDGVFKTYSTADGLSNNEVYDIYEDADGSLWLRTTGGGINHFRDGKITFFKNYNGVPVENNYATLRDRRGTLWMGVYPGGLVAFDGEKARSFGAAEGLKAKIVTAIYEDRAGNLWFGADGRVFKFADEKFTEYAVGVTAQNSRAAYITVIREDRDGNLWLGSTDGLYRFRAGEVSAFSVKDGLTNGEIVSIFEDREGSLWIGTHAGGLNRLRDTALTAYTVADGLVNNDVNGFYQTKSGDIWFGTKSGASLFRDGKFTNFTAADGLPNPSVYAFYEDRKNRLFAATLGGVCEFVGGKFKSDAQMQKQSGGGNFTVGGDRDGNLWVSSYRTGITRFHPDAAGNYTEAKTFNAQNGLSDNRVQSFLADRAGNVWVGTYDGGLTRISGDETTVFRKTDGLADDIISSVYEDAEGTIWVGTAGGISRFRDGKFANITPKNGLVDSTVGGIAEDAQNNFWIAADKGVYRVARGELNAVADGQKERVSIELFDTTDGLKTRESNAGGFRAADGRIWLLSVKGAAVLDPARLAVNNLPPPVYVERFIAEDTEIKPTETATTLEAGTQNLEFHYAGLSYVAPAKVKYRYRLDNFDQDWIDADTRRVAYYTNLPPGDYVFRVAAANNDGVWSVNEPTVRFTLRPFFYQTRWFYALCAVALILVGIGAVRWRTSRLKAQQKRLSRMVEERTGELQTAYRLIERDNERKTKELEEARQLQLSMLPKKLPQIAGLEIAAYMKPASEVGGDYYDFHVGKDGTLTVAVGDATGHGLKAGTIVTATKSLFNNLADAPDIPATFNQMSRSLKQLNLRGLFMAMTLLKIRDGAMTLGIAGMPSVLIYRNENKRVEETAIRALPLGSMAKYNYREQQIPLFSGDVVLLMSDGFPEMFNVENEMLGFEKAAEILPGIAKNSSQEIINHLVKVGENWAGTRPQDDDVTFVVLKIV